MSTIRFWVGALQNLHDDICAQLKHISPCLSCSLNKSLRLMHEKKLWPDWFLCGPKRAEKSLWSDCADVQADLSPCLVPRSFCNFCSVLAHSLILVIISSGGIENWPIIMTKNLILTICSKLNFKYLGLNFGGCDLVIVFVRRKFDPKGHCNGVSNQAYHYLLEQHCITYITESIGLNFNTCKLLLILYHGHSITHVCYNIMLILWL